MHAGTGSDGDIVSTMSGGPPEVRGPQGGWWLSRGIEITPTSW